MKFKKIVILFVLSIIFVISICNLVQSQAKKTLENSNITYKKITVNTTLKLGVSDYDNINPLLTKNRDIIQINQFIFEPLLSITEDYKIKPCLAKEWSKLQDKSYIIKLKDNVKWHNGENFNSQDIKFTIEQLQKLNSIYTENVKDIISVDIIDNYTIRINLNKEIPFFEYNLTFPIISKNQYSNKNIEKSKEIPLGTGGYKINTIDNNHVELIKNDTYIQNGNIDKIIITKYKTMGEVYNAFKDGEIDIFQTTNENLEKYIGSMGYQTQEFKGREFDFLAINCESEILKNREVRQALFYSINQEEITTNIFANKKYSSYFPLDYGSYALKDINSTANKQIAIQILKNAGWKNINGAWSKVLDGKKTTIQLTIKVCEEDKQRIMVANKIKEQLKNIGIKINIEKISRKSYNSCINNCNFELLLTGVYNSYSPNLNTFLGNENIFRI